MYQHIIVYPQRQKCRIAHDDKTWGLSDFVLVAFIAYEAA